jgi:hypothetical protein
MSRPSTSRNLREEFEMRWVHNLMERKEVDDDEDIGLNGICEIELRFRFRVVKTGVGLKRWRERERENRRHHNRLRSLLPLGPPPPQILAP